MKDRIEFIQKVFAKDLRYIYAGSINGQTSPPLESLMKDYLGDNYGITHLSKTKINKLNAEKLVIYTIQLMGRRHGLYNSKIDGLWGPNSQAAFDGLQHKIFDEKPKIITPNNIPGKYINHVWIADKDYVNGLTKTKAPIQKPQWPKSNTTSLNNFYGPVGTNTSKCHVPYEMKLSWDYNKKLSAFTCNKKCVESFERIFQRIYEAYGAEGVKELKLDLFSGCLSVRPIRGGSTYSRHSWSCAVDLADQFNKLQWGRDKALFAKPEYAIYWRIILDEGAKPLGLSWGKDFMHFEMTHWN